MAKDKPDEQGPPRPVRLYPPVEEAYGRLGKTGNFNYDVNVALGAMLGIAPDMLTKYKRTPKSTKGGSK